MNRAQKKTPMPMDRQEKLHRKAMELLREEPKKKILDIVYDSHWRIKEYFEKIKAHHGNSQ